MRYLVRFVAICAAVAVIGTALTFLLVPQLAAIGSANHGEAAPINLDVLPQRSLIYDSNGNVAATLFAGENRSSVPLSQVPHTVQAAVLAVEDDTFYSHKGINLRATLRALFTNVSTGEVQQGGSTITMQLIKNALPAPKRDLERKTQEAVLAWRTRHESAREVERVREAEATRHRRLLIIAVAAVVLAGAMAGVTVFAFSQRSEADTQAGKAHARALDASALSLLSIDPELSLALGVGKRRM